MDDISQFMGYVARHNTASDLSRITYQLSAS
jgi:hypothetical protein